MTPIKKSTLAKQVTFESYFLSRYGVNLDNSKREVVILDPTRNDKKPSISINFQKQLLLSGKTQIAIIYHARMP